MTVLKGLAVMFGVMCGAAEEVLDAKKKRI
jgi:hypothetical protein